MTKETAKMYLTPQEVALHSRVTPQTVCNWCNTGKLPATRFGRQWRIIPDGNRQLMKIAKEVERRQSAR
jgi:excisionase family DNA binding protein